MQIWNKDSNIADDMVRVVNFKIETDQGPGEVTTVINKGVNMEDAKVRLLDEIVRMGGSYQKIEIVSYEIVEFLAGDLGTGH